MYTGSPVWAQPAKIINELLKLNSTYHHLLMFLWWGNSLTFLHYHQCPFDWRKQETENFYFRNNHHYIHSNWHGQKKNKLLLAQTIEASPILVPLPKIEVFIKFQGWLNVLPDLKIKKKIEGNFHIIIVYEMMCSKLSTVAIKKPNLSVNLNDTLRKINPFWKVVLKNQTEL